MSAGPPRYTRDTQRETGIISRSAGADAAELSRALEDFSARRNDQLDQRAHESGLIAGQQGGAAGLPANANENTIKGRAFNQGALLAHQAALQTDIRDSVGRFQLESPDDPAAFDAKVAGLKDGLLKGADARLQPFIEQRLADYAGRAKLDVIGNQQQKLRKAATDDLNKGADGFFDDATTAAFQGDPLMVEARRQELDHLLETGTKSGLIDEANAAALRKKFDHEVTSQEVVGNFDRTVRAGGPEAGAASIRRWQETKPGDVGLTSDEHEGVTRQLITLQNREQALRTDERVKKDAAFRAEHNLRQDRVRDAISTLQSGFAPNQADAKQITEDLTWLKQSGDVADQQAGSQLATNFDVANAIQGQVHDFRRAPAPARAEALSRLESSLRKGGANRDQVGLLDALRKTNSEVNTQLEQDPRGYVQREGLVQDAPLDFSSAENLASSLDRRGGATDIGRQITGAPLPRLTAAEATQLGQVYNAPDTSIEERTALLGVVTAGAGDEAEATLHQLDSHGYKRMALLGSFVMGGQGALARDVMRGEAVLANDSGIKPKRQDSQADIDNLWGAALSDWPEQRAEYLDAATAKYAELKNRQGDLSDIYVPKLMRQALDEVMPTAKFNGRSVAIPPGATPRAFRDWTNAWTPKDFVGVAGGEPAQLADLVQSRGRLVELGAGRYGIAIGSAADSRDKVLVNVSGRPVTFKYGAGRTDTVDMGTGEASGRPR